MSKKNRWTWTKTVGNCGILTWGFSHPSCLSWSTCCARMEQAMKISNFSAALGRGSLDLKQWITLRRNHSVGIDYLRDGKVGKAKSSPLTRLWSWLGQVYSWLRLHAFTAKTREVPTSHTLPADHEAVHMSREMGKGQAGCRRWETWKWLNFECAFPDTDPLTHDRHFTGSRWLNTITGWLASHRDIRTTPRKADLKIKTSFKKEQKHQ